jgi:cell division protein FtsX
MCCAKIYLTILTNEVYCDWRVSMKTKEKKLEEKIKTLIGIEKLTYKDIEEIIEEMNKKCTTS